MLHKWRFLTGSLPELKRVWRAYGIAAAVVNGAIDHTPATYVIDPTGVESRLYHDPDGVLERRVSSATSSRRASAALLPGHPRLRGTAASLAATEPPRSRPARDAAAGRRRQRSPRPRLGGAPRPVLRHVGVGDRRTSPPTSSRSTSTRGSRRARASAAARRGRRGRVEASPQALPTSCAVCRTASRIPSRSTPRGRSQTGTACRTRPGSSSSPAAGGSSSTRISP